MRILLPSDYLWITLGECWKCPHLSCRRVMSPSPESVYYLFMLQYFPLTRFKKHENYNFKGQSVMFTVVFWVGSINLMSGIRRELFGCLKKKEERSGKRNTADSC